MNKKRNVSDKTWRRMIFWNMASQTNRYPGGGNFPMPMTRSFIPLLTEVYADQPDLIVEKEMRYLNEYCNTESTTGLLMLGAMNAIEASKVENASDISNALKISLMGPLAGIGDAIFKVGGKVIFSAMAGYMALEGNPVGILICSLWALVTIICKYYFFIIGYDQGTNFISNMADQIGLVTNVIGVLGLVVIGNCIPSTVKLTTKLVLQYGESAKPIQEILDSIFPFLLPCLLTFGLYKLLGVKGMTTVKIVWIVLIAGVVLSILGIC
ncbi:MAG: PTS system mannose/fructose/sorbose family transporter subunit IID [Erysipelotrichaceae bacterium]|mgnify:CR=1 FL=1|jgi:PTS system mannose-specific IID component